MNLDWDRLRVFQAVADAGSLTHSGTALNISQSAVSRQISALERELGVQLFYRHARGLVLTSEGETLYKTSRSVCAQLSATLAAISESHQGMHGPFKIAATIAFGSIWLAPRLKQFFTSYPNIKASLYLTDDEVDFVMGEADVSIRLFKGLVDPDLVYEKMFDFKLKAYANNQYIEKKGQPKSLEELDDHQLLVFGNETNAPVSNINWLLRAGCNPGIIREPYLVLNNAYGLLQCVKSGLGIALLPDFVEKDNPDILDLFPDQEIPANEVFLIYPKRLIDSARIQNFKTFLTQNIQQAQVS